ncbi:uncharacterized protein DS421_19g643530 [Arachis hypogaea]|uniref:Uncharacterized protein n=1 Tax=Arachis hypogaea TaxID=3818 RepID=A0A6B9V5V1_ARAHY|nr:uncharacterized protein DS421_19g643530 [Arachis hypogaea]
MTFSLYTLMLISGLSVIEARSLNKLVLKGRIRFDKEFLNPSVKFSSLCVLSLSYVHFDDEGTTMRLECNFRDHFETYLARERRVSRGGGAGTPPPLSQAAPPRLWSPGIALTSLEAAVENSASLP